MTAKILVVGSVNGQFYELAQKTSIINSKHGPFDFVLCTGDFFSLSKDHDELDKLLSGDIIFDVPTYFITGKSGLPEQARTASLANFGTICTNLIYLGKRGIFKTLQGIKIAYLSGVYDQDAYEAAIESSNSSSDAYIHQSSVSFLMSKLDGLPVDILLTCDWPSDITRYSTKDINFEELGVPQIKSLALKAKSRYHFTSNQNIFYEREPYYNLTYTDQEKNVTRFLSLGHVQNTDKVRWFYAFNLNTNTNSVPPDNTTPCPFGISGTKRTENDNNGRFFFEQDQVKHKKQRLNTGKSMPPNGYICRICNEEGHFIKDCPNKIPRFKSITPSECWFCLANPKITKHLIISIGSEVYLTLPRGQLPVTTENPSKEGVPGGGHVLIIPLEHHPTFDNIDESEYENVLKEIQDFKLALQKLYKDYNHLMVSFEISRVPKIGTIGGGHAHIQIIPVPETLLNDIEISFKETSEIEGIHFVNEQPSHGSSYFRINLPNGTSLYHKISDGERFNLQFGRKLLANLLGFPEREDWKSCALNEEKETEDARKFKEVFKKYDFTLK